MDRDALLENSEKHAAYSILKWVKKFVPCNMAATIHVRLVRGHLPVHAAFGPKKGELKEKFSSCGQTVLQDNFAFVASYTAVVASCSCGSIDSRGHKFIVQVTFHQRHALQHRWQTARRL